MGDMKRYLSQEIIMKEGDSFDRFFIVNTGTIEVLMHGECISTLTSKQAFVGNFVVGASCNHTFRAQVDSELWFMLVEDFLKISTFYRKARLELKINFFKKVKVGGRFLGDILDAHQIHSLALAAGSEDYNAGDVIIKEGDVGDMFYIIEEGTVDISTTASSVTITSMSDGDFFGENALLSDHGDDIRTATCVASSDTTCLTLTRTDFDRMLGNL